MQLFSPSGRPVARRATELRQKSCIFCVPPCWYEINRMLPPKKLILGRKTAFLATTGALIVLMCYYMSSATFLDFAAIAAIDASADIAAIAAIAAIATIDAIAVSVIAPFLLLSIVLKPF